MTPQRKDSIVKRKLITLLAALLAVGLVAAPAAGASERGPREDLGSIVDVALAINAETGEFDTLIAAVVGAGLVDALAAPDVKTVFAPTDEAFAALGLDETNIVDALGVETLTDILLYHVAPGAKSARAIVQRGGGTLRTLNGQTATLAVGEGVTINDANVIATDVFANNGIIHVIDGVLLP